MVEPISILSFLLSLSGNWRNPNIIVISPISDIKNEPVYQRAIQKDQKTRWVAEKNLRRFSREGWEPLTERDNLARPSIFMDANKKLLVMCRKTAD